MNFLIALVFFGIVGVCFQYVLLKPLLSLGARRAYQVVMCEWDWAKFTPLVALSILTMPLGAVYFGIILTFIGAASAAGKPGALNAGLHAGYTYMAEAMDRRGQTDAADAYRSAMGGV